MSGLQWLAQCIWTTRPDAYGFVGLVVGGLVGVILAFRTQIEVVRSPVMNGLLIGKLFAVIFALLGGLLGEVVRVFWTGGCEP